LDHQAKAHLSKIESSAAFMKTLLRAFRALLTPSVLTSLLIVAAGTQATRAALVPIQEGILGAGDAAYNERFGNSVSLSADGTVALVGAFQDNQTGGAYVFVRTGSTWTQLTRLLASDGAAEDRFGYSVSLAGDTALVGAYFDDDNGINSGSVYVFRKENINLPPVFGTPTPVNNSTNNSLSLNWSIPISDPEGNQFSWTIQCSNGQTTSGTSASNGTKSIALSGLAISTSYKVWVNATDPASGYSKPFSE
jgi:hypothetical protein